MIDALLKYITNQFQETVEPPSPPDKPFKLSTYTLSPILLSISNIEHSIFNHYFINSYRLKYHSCIRANTPLDHYQRVFVFTVAGVSYGAIASSASIQAKMNPCDFILVFNKAVILRRSNIIFISWIKRVESLTSQCNFEKHQGWVT
jgi:hypothetical protein